MRSSRSALLPSSSLSTSNFATLILCVLIFSTLSFAAAPDRIAGAINSSQTFTLAKSHHFKAQPRYDRGPVDPSFKLTYVTLLMAPSASQQQELDQLLVEQQNPRSPLYHKWLTPQQYGDRFGLSPNDLGKITAWLTSEGFQIISIGGGQNTVIVSGTAAQAQRAFGAEIHNYQVDGVQHFANSTPLRMPAILEGIVASVMGLHDFRPVPAHGGKPLGAARKARPAWYDNNYIFPNFLAPGDIYTIYDIPSTLDGTGQTLAIVGQTDVYLDDINDFRNGFSLNPISSTDCTTDANGIIIPPCNDPYFAYVLNGPDGGVFSDIGEADLDIEWSGAAARNAQVIYVNSGGTANGVYDALTAAINPPSGPPISTVISMSYGFCESFFVGTLESVLQQGNAEGVTIMNSSGDQSAAGCDFGPPTNSVNYPDPPYLGAQYGLGVSYPASSQYVTGVGGTAITLADDSYPTQNNTYWNTTIGANGGTAKQYIPEIPWNDVEELALYCHNPAPHDTFCSSGGGTPDWVPLTTSATPQQVQADTWIIGADGGASNCWFTNGNFVVTSQGDEFVCLGPGPGPTNGGGFPQPLYQQGLNVPSAPSGANAVRYVPDVSLLASPNFPGYIFCTPQSQVVPSPSTCVSGIEQALDTYGSIVGGTSASSPIFAGMVALINQYLISKGVQTTEGLGNINFTLYKLAASHSTNNAFHQITTGDNLVYCQAGLPPEADGFPSNIVCPAAGVFGWEASNADPTTGYNLVNGLGSVDVNNLAVAFANLGAVTTTTLTSSLNPANQGVTVTFTATVANTTGTNPPTGTVTFFNGTTSIGSGTISTVSGAQVATVSTNTLPVGTDSITGVYSGDQFNAASTSAVLSQVINAVTTVTTVTSNLNPANQGVTVTFTAHVSNTTGAHPPTGNVTFYDGSTSIGTGALTAVGTDNSTATFQTHSLAPGVHSITAVYPGDTFNSGSTSNVLMQTITAVTTTTVVTSNLNPASLGATVTLTATVANSVGAPAPTGNVQFMNGSAVIGTQALGTVGGKQEAILFTTEITNIGANSITAVYAGDQYNSGSTSAVLTETIQAPTFTFAIPNGDPTSHTVLAGQGTLNFTFLATPTGLFGAGTPTFANAVTFSCAFAPTDPTLTNSSCAFTPSTIAAGTQSPTGTPVTLSVTTAGPNTGTGSQLRRRADNRTPWLPLALPLAGIVVAGFAGRKVWKHSALASLCVALALLGLLVACGGSSSAPPIGVSVQAMPSSLYPNNNGWPSQTATMTATVTNTTNTAVTWGLSPSSGSCAGTPSPCGSLSSSTTNPTTYTAPTITAGLPASVTITATSGADMTKFGTAPLTLKPATLPGSYTVTVTATESGAATPTAPTVTLVVQ